MPGQGDYAGAEAALREALQLDERGEAEPEEEEEDAMPAFGDLGFLPQIEVRQRSTNKAVVSYYRLIRGKPPYSSIGRLPRY